jgi:hypothetical protein
VANDRSFADPAPRIIDFVNLFGGNGLVQPICADDLGPSLGRVADMILARLPP